MFASIWFLFTRFEAVFTQVCNNLALDWNCFSGFFLPCRIAMGCLERCIQILSFRFCLNIFSIWYIWNNNPSNCFVCFKAEEIVKEHLKMQIKFAFISMEEKTQHLYPNVHCMPVYLCYSKRKRFSASYIQFRRIFIQQQKEEL